MKLAFRTADCGQKSSRILQELLVERGLETGPARTAPESQGIVCYGWGEREGSQLPILNAKAGSVRGIEQLMNLSAMGISVPPFIRDIEEADFEHLEFPMLARHNDHVGGEGIQPVFQEEELAWRAAAGAQYFVKYIPAQTEYRIYTYRQRLLGAYEKVMARPEQYHGIGRNFKDGFDFKYIPSRQVPRNVVQLASNAVHHMGLDFGGVDIIHGKDGGNYVLEVNSAPGCFGKANVWINNLADAIVRWTENEFPKRSTTLREVRLYAE